MKEKTEQAQKLQREKKDKEMKDKVAKMAEEMSKIEGQLALLFNSLFYNTSRLEDNISGFDFKGEKCNLLATNLARNTSLLSIHMARMDISDE